MTQSPISQATTIGLRYPLRRVASCTAIVGLFVATAMVPSPAKAASLYDQFGQRPGITALISTFVGYVAADDRINYYFAHTNIPGLEAALVNQVGQATGGPEVYSGPSMRAAHANLGVTQAAFNALTEDLIKAMDDKGIPLPSQNELLSELAPMEHDIVTK